MDMKILYSKLKSKWKDIKKLRREEKSEMI